MAWFRPPPTLQPAAINEPPDIKELRAYNRAACAHDDLGPSALKASEIESVREQLGALEFLRVYEAQFCEDCLAVVPVKRATSIR